MPLVIPQRDLEALEEKVRAALRSADDSGLEILGYGEVTLVLKLRTGYGEYACKRLPVFPTRARFENYERLLGEYLQRLGAAGLAVAETRLWHQTLPGGRIVAYCVQEALPAERLCSTLLHTGGEQWAMDFFKRFLDHVERTVATDLGLDAQAANWIDTGGELVYLDVTTPLLRDPAGRERLDVPLFFTSLPWAMRDAVRLAMAKSIFEKFYSPRGVVLDFLGNLHKERLNHLVPMFLQQVNTRLAEPITAAEVAAYYRGDTRMWQLIQWLRRADRLWHRSVRRRTYPFLLPPDIDR
jgi:hypothetical protein